MPPRDRGVDSISSGLDKHDFTRGKVDRGNLPAGQWNARSAVSMGEGAGELGPLGSPESMTIDHIGYGGIARKMRISCRIRKVTEMLDNSGRELGEQRQKLAAHAGAQ